MNQREFKHTPGPWPRSYVFGAIRHIDKNVDRDLFVDPDDLKMSGHGDFRWSRFGEARLVQFAPALCALLAEIETAIMPLLPDIDPVIDIRKRVKELLDVIEKGEVSE